MLSTYRPAHSIRSPLRAKVPSGVAAFSVHRLMSVVPPNDAVCMSVAPAPSVSAPPASCAPAAPTPVAGAITPEQLSALAAARERARRIRRAALVAAISGWMLAVFAGLTLLSALFSPSAAVVGLALGGVAVIELRGAARLRRFDLRAPLHLTFNQIGLGVLVLLYCGWGIYRGITAPSMYEAHMGMTGMSETLGSIDRLHRVVTVGVYVCVGMIGCLSCGLTSVYYFTRRPHIAKYLRDTPAWLIETLRTAA